MKAALESRETLRFGPWPALVVIATGYFMNVLDSTVVNVAVPTIMTRLDTTTEQMLWIINGYLLPYALLLLVAGRLGDIYGHRNVFFTGLLIFTVASLLCGLARSPEELIAARVLAGIGAAGASPQAVAITSALFPQSRRGLAFGVLAMVVGVASVAGPALGGIITHYLGWRWIFFLNVPIGVLGLLGTFVFVPSTRNLIRQRLRPATVVLATAGLFALLFALIEGQRFGWGTVYGVLTIPHLLVIGLLLLIAVAVWE
ncbi:MAG: MFS transporter, partial [Pseudonocardiaceae bacterium]